MGANAVVRTRKPAAGKAGSIEKGAAASSRRPGTAASKAKAPGGRLKQTSGRTNPAAKSARPESSTVAAYNHIKQLILDNELAPGAQILEQTLADQLGLSRTPVREALGRLSQEGLIEVVPRHGMRVLPLSPDDMREIYEVLIALEPAATEMLALRKPSRDDVAPLLEACEAMEHALAADDLLAWAQADAGFHSALVSLCGNKRLAAMVSTVWEQSHRARMFTLRLRPKPERSTREHRKIVDAILSGDAARARDLYRAHRENAASAMMKLIDDYGLHRL